MGAIVSVVYRGESSMKVVLFIGKKDKMEVELQPSPTVAKAVQKYCKYLGMEVSEVSSEISSKLIKTTDEIGYALE